MSITKQDLIKRLAEQANVNQKQVEAVLDSLVDTIHASLKNGEDLTIHSLGKFTVSDRAARTGRNPSTGEAIQIAAKRVPTFTAAKALKDAVNG